jgi:hypothetical protein
VEYGPSRKRDDFDLMIPYSAAHTPKETSATEMSMFKSEVQTIVLSVVYYLFSGWWPRVEKPKKAGLPASLLDERLAERKADEQKLQSGQDPQDRHILNMVADLRSELVWMDEALQSQVSQEDQEEAAKKAALGSDTEIELSWFATIEEIQQGFFKGMPAVPSKLFAQQVDPIARHKLAFAEKLESRRQYRPVPKNSDKPIDAQKDGGFQALLGMLMWWVDVRVLSQLELSKFEVTKNAYSRSQQVRSQQERVF